MALVLTEEQSMLRDSARGLISDKAPVSHLRQLRDSKDATGFSRELWKDFAEMGFSGLLVPEEYSFWDLHVAIQNAMGWLDYHLHEFRLLDAEAQAVVAIGIPGDEPRDQPVAPGWDVPLSKFFTRKTWHATPALYTYDFGDDWEHVVVHEGIEPAERSRTYPRCVSGARRCPPEDCGGGWGYADLKEIMADPSHEEHNDMLEWLDLDACEDFDPKDFSVEDVNARLRSFTKIR